MDSKLRIGELEGSVDVIRELIKDEDVDLIDLLNAKKKVHIPFVMFGLFGFIFFVLCVCLYLISNEIAHMICLLAAVGIAVVIVAMVYMQWKSKTLMGIVSLGEAVMLALSLGIYTPKDVIKKGEDIVVSKFDIESE